MCQNFFEGLIVSHYLFTYLLIYRWIPVQISLQDPEVGLDRSYSNSSFIYLFLESAVLFSVAALPCYILTNSVQGSNLSASSPTFVIFFFFLFLG